ncbi:MFS transporter, partial [Salmonella sp. SAL04281]
VTGQLYLAIPLADNIAMQFSIDQKFAVFTSTVFGISYALGLLAFGALSDRKSRKQVLLFGLIGLAAATGFVAYAWSFEWFLFSRALQG